MYLIRRWRGALIGMALILTVLATERDVERYGDNLQIVLPLAGLGCSMVTGGAAEYFVRFVGHWFTVHVAKRTVAENWNARPSGGDVGFPSAHASSASFSCLSDAPILKTGIVLSAAYTGASRIEAQAHDIWQVLIGAIWGVAFERAFRGRGLVRYRLLAVSLKGRVGTRRGSKN